MQLYQRLSRSRPVKMISNLLRQGTSSRELSLTIVLGVILGIIPMFGFITAVCAALAAWLRLNIALAVAVFYAVMPLQLILFIPFIRLGEWIFGTERLMLAPDKVISSLQTAPLDFMLQIWHSVLAGLGAWAVVSLLLGISLYYLSFSLISRYRK